MIFPARFDLVNLFNTVWQITQTFSIEYHIVIIRAFDRACKFLRFKVFRTFIYKHDAVTDPFKLMLPVEVD